MNVLNNAKAKTVTFFLSGMAVAVGLGWNEAVKSGIDKYFPIDQGDGVRAKIIYAISLTLLLVFISLLFANVGVKPEPKKCTYVEQKDFLITTQVLNKKIDKIMIEKAKEELGLQ